MARHAHGHSARQGALTYLSYSLFLLDHAQRNETMQKLIDHMGY